MLDSLARAVPPGEETPETLEAASKLQSVANLLGEAEGCFGDPNLERVGGELTAA